MSLPSGYKRLEYIKSGGTQYVKTGFVPNQDTRIVYDCYRETASAAEHFFGVRTGNTTKNAFNFYIYNSGWRSGYNSTTTSVNGPSTGRYLIDKDKNVTYINGETLGTATYASFTSGGEAYLFAMQNVGSGIAYGSHRLYSCQIYDNGTIIRDYIPCQTTAGEIGLWDDVNSVFYGNAGTGTFTAGPGIAIAAAASEITELEYIRSSNTQYISSAINPNQDTRMDLRVSSTQTGSHTIAGTDVSWTGNGFAIGVGFAHFGTETANISGMNDGNTHDISLNKNVLSVGGEVKHTFSSQTFSIGYSLALFANNRAESIQEITEMNLHACQIYDDGTLIRDYISAKLSDGTVGLYDKLHGLLYINVGSGAFTAGPEVQKAPPAPTGFAASALTDTTVKLSWAASDGATGYNLYKNGDLLATLSDTSYTDTVQIFSGTVYAVTAYNDNGESEAATLTYYSTPDNPILYLVMDRTAADVNAGNDKGTYKASDLNRVGAAMNYVAARLREQGYDPHISPKTDWMDGEWVTPADEAVYLGDLAELRKQFTLYETTPDVPPRILATAINSNDGLTYTWANNIEQILVDIDALLTNIAAGWLYSGEIYSGEV